LDQRQRRQPIQQGNKTVSTTNHGFRQIQQHILRETQQQRLARPGQQQQTPPQSHANDENYLISPLISPQASNFDIACMSIYRDSHEQIPLFTSYPGQLNTTVKMEYDDSPGSNQFSNSESTLFPQDGLPSPYASPYIDFSAGLDDVSVPQDWGTIKASDKSSSSRRVSGGIADRVAMFEGMGAGSPSSRPITPPNQNALSMYCLHNDTSSERTNNCRLFSSHTSCNTI
jgi:regulatory protein SWI5